MDTVIFGLDVGLYIGTLKRKCRPIDPNNPLAPRIDYIDPLAMPFMNSQNITALFCAGGAVIEARDYETRESPMPSTEITTAEYQKVTQKLDAATRSLKSLIDEGHNVLVYAEDFRQQAALLCAYYLIKILKEQPDAAIRRVETCLFSQSERAEDVTYQSARAELLERFKTAPDQKSALDAELAGLEGRREARDKKRCLKLNSFKKLLRNVK